MNTIRELTQQEKYNIMLKRKNKEIKSLKEQLEYLRSNEYLNQVKWERDINEKLNNTYKLVIEKQDKDIERLNNIINELEKYCNEVIEETKLFTNTWDRAERKAIEQVLNKLKELKENSNEKN